MLRKKTYADEKGENVQILLDALRLELQAELDGKSYLLQKQNKAYNEYCKTNELRPLADRLKIARWGREQAAKARGAARRYENLKG